MIRKILDAINWLIVSLVMAVGLWPHADCYLKADELDLTAGKTIIVKLRTDGLATPLNVAGDPLKRVITSIEINGELPEEGDGHGTVTFDESTLEFNEFGDATIVKPKVGVAQMVDFKQLPKVEKNKGLRLYDLVFADGGFPDVMRLVLSDGSIGPHRLLIYDGQKRDAQNSRQMSYFFALNGLPGIQERIPNAPMRPDLHLAGISPFHDRAAGGLRRIDVQGTVGGQGRLELDSGDLVFNNFGDVRFSTSSVPSDVGVNLRHVEKIDPNNAGRRLLEIVTKNEWITAKYFLVLSPTDAGAHRLLIKKDEKLLYVLPLDDPERRYHLELMSQLDKIHVQERAAIVKLRQNVGYRFLIRIEGQSIVGLTVESGDDADRIDDTLKFLKELRSIEFYRSRLNSVGLVNLRELKKLERLRFSHSFIDDQGLATLKELHQLQGLWFYACEGITDVGISHLAELTNLHWLQLYNKGSLLDPGPNAKVITDVGLKNLEAMTKLEYLHIYGQRITDAGLKHLRDLANLQELHLSGQGITDAGLEQLHGLHQLRQLGFAYTQVTPAGKARLKLKLPELMMN